MKFSLVLFFLLSLTGFAQASTPSFSQNRLIVKLKKGDLLPQFHHSFRRKHLFKNLYVLETKNLKGLIKELKESSQIEYFEKDYYSKREKLPKVDFLSPEEKKKPTGKQSPFNDPKMNRLWSFADSERHGISINKTYRDGMRKEGQEIIVAVVDTGVDTRHNDLKDNIWVNEDEIPGNEIDDDGNGYIDDTTGINTLVRDADGNATGDNSDGHGHGTHVSGTIAAVQNNSLGVAGIAKNVKIMGIRTVPNRSDELDLDVIDAFLYAAKNGAKIINCSFGKDHNEGGMAVKETIDHIGEVYGVLVVAAAGNSSRDIESRRTYPASFESENLLVVASSTKRGRMSYFSNYGTTSVDIVAPGSSIYSTMPNHRYGSMSGTSMASPTVAGVAAEVLSQHPELTPVELKKVLMDNVVKLKIFSKKVVSGGRIDLFKTLKALEK